MRPYRSDYRVRQLFANATGEGLPHPFGTVHRVRILLTLLDYITIERVKPKESERRPMIPIVSHGSRRSKKSADRTSENGADKQAVSGSSGQLGEGHNVQHTVLTIEEEDDKLVGLKSLQFHKIILEYYPLHVKTIRKALWLEWLQCTELYPNNLPTDKVKDYLGEKIGLYFKYLIHYTRSLVYLSVISFVVSILLLVDYYKYNSNFSKGIENPILTPIYCAIVCVWTVFLRELWLRQEATTALKWGMTEFEREEKVRPQFHGEYTRSYINGLKTKFFSPYLKRQRKIYVTACITGCILIVLASVSCIYLLRYYFLFISKSPYLNTNGSTIASIINSIQIQIYNYLYTSIALYLNDYENFRTETEYEDALIYKLFAFQFVNGYSSLFYVAFVKQQIGDSCQPACSSELGSSLLIIFGKSACFWPLLPSSLFI